MTASTSPIFSDAIDRWRVIREEFEVMREAAYELAHEECHGVLLNARGRQAGISPYSLFIGSAIRAYAYASPELVEHWQTHPRVTFEQYERQRATDGY